MKANRNLFYLMGLMYIVLITVLASCKKDDPNQGLEAPRLFKPSGISIKTTQTTAEIKWRAPVLSSKLKLSYLAEFSQDSTFVTSEFSAKLDTTGVVVTDERVAVRKKYYVRIKALATVDQPESEWLVSTWFTISGEQLFYPLRDLEIKEAQVTLRWKPTAGLDKITLAPMGGTAISYAISSSEGTAGVKIITGLTPGLDYYAELFAGGKSKGILSFSTPAPTVYATILNPGADLVSAINAAANNTIIGLNPGTYSAGSANFTLLQKSVTLKSTSGNPSDTKVNFKEFTLRGTGAGINLNGIELDGTALGSLYFINPTGAVADAEKVDFANVTINNCIVHGATTSFMRANRGAAAGDYKMDQIVVKNSIVYDIGSTLGYICFHLDKLQFNSLSITRSTFYNFGQALLTCSTVTPTPPTIIVDYCTFNNFGANARYVLMDANANPVRFNMTNSIIGNVPRPAGTANGVAIRAGGAGTSMVFSYNNLFNFTTTASGPSITLPTANLSQAGNQAEILGWGATTSDFTIPATSSLRTASSGGTPIGDPRWTY